MAWQESRTGRVTSMSENPLEIPNETGAFINLHSSGSPPLLTVAALVAGHPAPDSNCITGKPEAFRI